MTNPKTHMRRAFERAAASYDEAAELQREVARRLAGRLDAALALSPRLPERILDAGSGTGYGEELLRSRLPGRELLELDIACAMLRTARERRAGHRPSLAVCGDVERLPLAAGCVDLVWSSLALQWASDGGGAFVELARCLAPGGVLLFASLGPGTLAELDQAFAGVDRYRHVNRFVKADELGASLARAGFTHVRLEEEEIVLEYDDARDVMRGLKAIGARRVMQDGLQGLMGKVRWRQAVANYELLRREGRLPATYGVIYGMAVKP